MKFMAILLCIIACWIVRIHGSRCRTESLKPNVTALEESVTSMHDIMMNMTAAIQANQDKMDNAVAANTAAIQAIQANQDITKLSDTVKANTAALQDIQENQNNTKLSDEVSANTKATANLESNLNTISKTVTNNEKAVSANAAALAKKCDTSTCTAIQSANTKWESNINTISKSVMNNEKAVRAAEKSIQANKESITKTIQSTSNLRNTVSANSAALGYKCAASTCTAIQSKAAKLESKLGKKCDDLTCSATQTNFEKLETCLGDINSNDCPPAEEGKISLIDAIQENKGEIAHIGGSGFERCVVKWCLQDGTSQQYTRCEEARDGGNTCVNPQIKYGTTEGGIPHKHNNNDHNTWCKMIFKEERIGSVELGSRDCSAPKGKLWWCSGADESIWKWCDWSDSFWKDDSLNHHSGCTSSITSLTCRKGCINGIATTTMTIEGREVEVRCEDGEDISKAWTVIQRRGQYGNSEDYFYKTFSQYEKGFGSVKDELWIGLKNIAALTNNGEWELQVDLTDWDNKVYHAKYSDFSVKPAPLYQLYAGEFDAEKSTLGDSLALHNTRSFSTYDVDNDIWKDNCAEKCGGAWWYRDCHYSNLNGVNFASQKDDPWTGISWYNGKARGNTRNTWKASVMKIRKKNGKQRRTSLSRQVQKVDNFPTDQQNSNFLSSTEKTG